MKKLDVKGKGAEIERVYLFRGRFFSEENELGVGTTILLRKGMEIINISGKIVGF